jgi:hypothetical protein
MRCSGNHTEGEELSEQIILFDTLDELRAWSEDKNAMPGGWFDERKVYLVIDEGPIMVTVTEGKR